MPDASIPNMPEPRADAAREEALRLLRHPVLPLVTIAGFLLYSGGCADVDTLLAELPPTIETETARYDDARAWLVPYQDELARLACGVGGNGGADLPTILDKTGAPLDAASALRAVVAQAVLDKELAHINSLLCGAEHCTLCCIGPDAAMRQEYFHIPLRPEETPLFPDTPRVDAAARSLDDVKPGSEAAIVRHRRGTSLVLPRLARCPALDGGGRCSVYADRPRVCRKPQIFPYVLEELDEAERPGEEPAFRLRDALLAVTDCPYVRTYQDEIARYAAAAELELVLRQNKA